MCRRGQGVLELPPALEAAAGQEVQQAEGSAKRRRLSSRRLAGQLKQLSRSESRGGSQQDLAHRGPSEGYLRKACLVLPASLCRSCQTDAIVHAAEAAQPQAAAGAAAGPCPPGHSRLSDRSGADSPRGRCAAAMRLQTPV